MNGLSLLPSVEALKAQAKRLRSALETDGTTVGHSQSLELLAHQHGYRDWNTLYAAIGNRPVICPVVPGQRTSGQYLGQSFRGEVLSVQNLVSANRFRLTLLFDEPVDVVTFDSFSAFRKRVSCTIGVEGFTTEKTSNGQPQLRLDL